ncbi:hypothetical protein GCM10008955_36310 [Deinococcus malanensis]|uniref:Transposase DDE domain-containing protein n=1 Tax=Deinococcus malanensis TaxID=1706855 RepID=A0ABQ2F1Z6_9DEIO|nr:hypothetical protein GCM10008955_36310 [Deinococcus malanensis]
MKSVFAGSHSTAQDPRIVLDGTRLRAAGLTDHAPGTDPFEEWTQSRFVSPHLATRHDPTGVVLKVYPALFFQAGASHTQSSKVTNGRAIQPSIQCVHASNPSSSDARKAWA